MRKVTTPSRKDVQATTSVVLIAVFLFGLYFWVIDNVIGRGVDYLFRFFAK
jgi:preprotein translocase subunit SecE